MGERMLQQSKGLYLAADVEPDAFPGLMEQMQGVEGLTGVKLGFELGLGLSLCAARNMVKSVDSDLVVVYDHQKAGNDIPQTGEGFGRTMERGHVDAAILFPFTGPKAQEAWTKGLTSRGIKAISGAEMTHDMIAAVLHKDGSTTEGYIHPGAFARMFELAVKLEVRDFVVPGNKPDKVAGYKAVFDREIGEGNYTLWAPGFVDQGGDVSETGKVAGPRFNAIVGGGIYNAENPHAVAQDLGRKMMALNNAE